MKKILAILILIAFLLNIHFINAYNTTSNSSPTQTSPNDMNSVHSITTRQKLQLLQSTTNDTFQWSYLIGISYLNHASANTPIFFDSNRDNYQDIIFSSNTDGKIVSLDGRTGAMLWYFSFNNNSAHVFSNPVLGDFGTTGQDSLLVCDITTGSLISLNPYTGSSNWQSGTGCLSTPVVADINSDGIPEIIINEITDTTGAIAAINGSTGKTIWQYGIDFPIHSPPVVGDLYNDGQTEVIFEGTIRYDNISTIYYPVTGIYVLSGENGNLINLKEIPGVNNGYQLLLANLEGGKKLDIIYSYKNYVLVLNSTLDTLWEYNPAYMEPSPPICIADMNRDGILDIVLVDQGIMELNGLDGSVIREINGSGDPISLIDVNLDRIPDFVEAGSIIDGRTGAVLCNYSGNALTIGNLDGQNTYGVVALTTYINPNFYNNTFQNISLYVLPTLNFSMDWVGTYGSPLYTGNLNAVEIEDLAPHLLYQESEDQITLQWSPGNWHTIKSPLYFNIYKKTCSDQNLAFSFLSKTQDMMYTDNFSPNQGGNCYMYMVSSIGSIGGSYYSNIIYGVARSKADNPSLQYSIGNSSIYLHWNYPNSRGLPISGFKIYRTITGQTEQLLAQVSHNYYLDTDVTNGLDDYSYRITTLNQFGESNGTTIQIIPTGNYYNYVSPPELSVINEYNSTYVSWTAPAILTHGVIAKYEIYRAENSTTNFTYLNTSKSLDYYDNTIKGNTTYSYYVMVFANNSNVLFTSDSNIISLKTKSVPDRPLFVRMTRTEQSGLINWNANPGSRILSYNVYRAVNCYQNGVNENFTLLTTTTNNFYNDYSSIQGLDYCMVDYYITAQNEYGESQRSNIVGSFIPKIEQLHPIITSLDVNGHIILNLGSSYDFTSVPMMFNISRSSRNSIDVYYNSIQTNLFIDTNTQPGVTYYYSIVPFNLYEIGSAITAYRLSITPPSQPDGVKLSMNPVQRAIYIIWNIPTFNGGSPIESYTVYRTVNGHPLPSYKDITINGFTDVSVAPANNYTYFVTASNAAGESKASLNKTITFYAVPTTMKAVDYTVNSNNSISITWSAPDDTGGKPIKEYKIYRSDSINTTKKLIKELSVSLSNVTQFSYVDNDYQTMKKKIIVTYEITAVTDIGESAPSSPLDVYLNYNNTNKASTGFTAFLASLSIGTIIGLSKIKKRKRQP